MPQTNSVSNLDDLVPDDVLKTWAEKAGTNDAYKAMTPEEQDNAKDAFFKMYVAPKVDDKNFDKAYATFRFATESDPKSLYNNDHFTHAETLNQQTVLRKNLVANGQDPEEQVTIPFDQEMARGYMAAKTGTDPYASKGLIRTKSDQAYYDFQHDPDVIDRLSRLNSLQLQSGVTGVAQTAGAIIGSERLMDWAGRRNAEMEDLEQQFPGSKGVRVIGEALPVVLSAGALAPEAAVTEAGGAALVKKGAFDTAKGIAKRSATAGAVTAATTPVDGDTRGEVVSKKATAGILAGLMNAALETVFPVGTAIWNRVSKSSSERAIESAAAKEAKLNGTTQEEEIQKAHDALLNSNGGLTATKNPVIDRATADVTDKAEIVGKEKARAIEQIKTNLNKVAAEKPTNTSRGVGQDIAAADEAAVAQADAGTVAKNEEINSRDYAVPQGNAEAGSNLLETTNNTIAFRNAQNKANYQREIAPAENAVVGTYADAKAALDNATLGDGLTPLSASPDLKARAQKTTGYKQISSFVPEEEAAVLDPQTQSLVDNLTAAGRPEEAQKLIAQLAPNAAKEAEPLTLGALNRHIDDLEAELAPQFQKSNPGVRVDVLKAQKDALVSMRNQYLEANPDVAAIVGKADQYHAATQKQLFQSDSIIGGQKIQNSVVKNIYGKAQDGTLEGDDLGKMLFTSGNHKQTLSDFRKALGDHPELDKQIGDAFYDYVLKNKLPQVDSAAARYKALNKILDPNSRDQIGALAKEIPAGEGKTIYDQLDAARQAAKEEAFTVASGEANLGKGGQESPFIKALTSNKQSSATVEKLFLEPDTLGDAALQFRNPTYGKKLQSGVQADVMDDMLDQAHPEKLVTKYDSPDGKRVLDTVFDNDPEGRQLIDDAISASKDVGDLDAIKHYGANSGASKLGPEAKGLTYEALKAKTASITSVFSAIQKKLDAHYQAELAQVLTNKEYAKQVTDKVAMGMTQSAALKAAYNKVVRPSIAAAAMTTGQKVKFEPEKPSSVLND